MNRLLKYLALLLMVLYNQLLAQAPQHGVLSGTVRYANGTPAEMATVYIQGSSLHAYTDEHGHFSITNIPLKRGYNLVVKAFDLKEVILKVDMNKLKQRINITLRSDGHTSLGEVIVAGKSQGRHLRERGFAVEAIDTKMATLQSIQTTELLNRSAGIKIRQSAGLGSDISFNLNGLSGNSVRIFIDGIPLRNYGRSFSLASIPPSMIERIEVYKGVLPSELAEDALGGGINVVLKKDLRNALTTSYSIGSFNTHQWDLNGSYRDKLSGFTAQISGFYSSTDNSYKVWGDNVYVVNQQSDKEYIKATRFHDSFLAYGVRGSLGLTKRSWADELLLGFMLSKTDKDIQTGATMQVVYGNRRTEYSSRLASLQYKKKDLLLKGLDLSTLFTYSHTNRQVIDTIADMYTWHGTVGIRPDSRLALWISGAEAGQPTLATNLERNFANRSSLHYRLGRNHTLGISYLLDAFTRDIDDPLLSLEAQQAVDQRRYSKQVVGTTYQGKFLEQRLKASLFFKHYQMQAQLTEVVQQSRPGLSPTYVKTRHNRRMRDNGYGIALSYTLTPRLILLASAERAIRLPSTNELLGNTSDNIDPSLGLRPESSTNINLGVNLGPLNIGGHDLSADVNLFVRDIRDMIQRGIPRTNDDFFRFENIGAIISRGIDVELRHAWRNKVFVNANMSYFDARFNLEYDPATGVRYAHYRSRLRNAPYLTGNFNVEYIVNNALLKHARLSLSYNFSYTHKFLRDWEAYGSANKPTIPTQDLHDLGLTYTLPNRRLTIGLNAKNILDRQVFDNFALQKPGRSFFAKVTYRIF